MITERKKDKKKESTEEKIIQSKITDYIRHPFNIGLLSFILVIIVHFLYIEFFKITKYKLRRFFI